MAETGKPTAAMVKKEYDIESLLARHKKPKDEVSYSRFRKRNDTGH